MKRTTANILGLLCVALLMTLSISVHMQPNEGYTKAQLKHRSDEIAMLLKNYKHPKQMTQREALMSVWNLTEADVAKPVKLWGEK